MELTNDVHSEIAAVVDAANEHLQDGVVESSEVW